MSDMTVRDFYTGKNIFITGSTGFLGVCLLEKLLRCVPDVGDIYLLLRPKKDKEISERLDEIKKNKIFETLLENKNADEVNSYPLPLRHIDFVLILHVFFLRFLRN